MGSFLGQSKEKKKTSGLALDSKTDPTETRIAALRQAEIDRRLSEARGRSGSFFFEAGQQPRSGVSDSVLEGVGSMAREGRGTGRGEIHRERQRRQRQRNSNRGAGRDGSFFGSFGE